MKKVLALILALVMICSMFTACSPKEETTNPDAPAEPNTDQNTENPTAAEPGNTDAGKEFVLGAVAPLSGSAAISGQIMLNAVKMAVDEINAEGGINGEVPIKLVYEDDEGVPANSVTVVQKLVEQDNIDMLLGSVPSSCTLANMEVTKAAGVPHITPCSSNATITQVGNEYIYRMTATDPTHAKTLLKYASEHLGATKIAMLYESSDFGTGAFKIVSELCGDYGIEMVTSEIYNSGDTDFSVQLTKMQSKEPDVFLFWGYHTEVALIGNQMKQYGIEIPVIGTGYNSPELTSLGGAGVEGIVLTTAFDAANPDPTVQAFDAKYASHYGAGYDQNAPQSYDAVYLIADAVTRCINDGADWSDSEVLNGYIATANFDGATGNTSFDENGEMVKELMVIQIVDGEHTIVEW